MTYVQMAESLKIVQEMLESGPDKAGVELHGPDNRAMQALVDIGFLPSTSSYVLVPLDEQNRQAIGALVEKAKSGEDDCGPGMTYAELLKKIDEFGIQKFNERIADETGCSDWWIRRACDDSEYAGFNHWNIMWTAAFDVEEVFGTATGTLPCPCGCQGSDIDCKGPAQA